MKRLIALFLSVIMVFGFCGCRSEQEDEVYTVVVKVMEAIKTNDFNLINMYAGSDTAAKKMFVVDTNDLTKFAKLKMHKAMRDKIEYSIGDVEVSGSDSATAVVTVSVPKASMVYGKHASLLAEKKDREFYKAMAADIAELDVMTSKEYTVNFQYKDNLWMMDYAFIEMVYDSLTPRMF